MSVYHRYMAAGFCASLAAAACSTSELAADAPGLSVPATGGSSGQGNGGGPAGTAAGGAVNGTAAGGSAGESVRTSTSLGLFEAEAMERAGPYAAVISSPFAGVGLYANEDAVGFSVTFPNIPGVYRIEAWGASSSTTTARLELLLNTASRGIAPGISRGACARTEPSWTRILPRMGKSTLPCRC